MSKIRTIGYIRVSTDQQNLEQQKHLLLAYAQQHKFLIDEFVGLCCINQFLDEFFHFVVN